MDSDLPEGYLVVGRITGTHGVRGWVKVYSHTDPRDNIIRYRDWLVRRPTGWEPLAVEDGRAQGKGVVVALFGVDSREEAALLLGSDIAIRRDLLPPAGDGEFYWADLEGLDVYAGARYLGTVSHLMETGANDVLVVKGDRERLIPFVLERYVTRVDLAAGRIDVDWDPDF